ncbi:MAG TPA: hypothetical protein VFQ44_24380, partial [Streptosporangiaceae bacterium]|nr:hypothetical protein [Streptosporangiaceae bacterium]
MFVDHAAPSFVRRIWETHVWPPVLAEVPGKPGAVAAGALHPDQRDLAEPVQPAQQAGMPGRRRREVPRPGQPSDRIRSRGHVNLGVGVYPAGDGSSFFYDGHCRPFLVKGWHAPA